MPTDDPLDYALGWMAAGEAVAIATVVRAWGSAPCPPGSRMAIAGSGRIAGSVSGGCVEGAVVQAALQVLAGSPPALLEFGIEDAQAWSVGLACGGRLQVLVEAAPANALAGLAAARQAKRPAVLATRLPAAGLPVLHRLFHPEPQAAAPGIHYSSGQDLGGHDLAGAAGSAVARAAQDASAADRAAVVALADGDWLFTPANPAHRLIVVGAVHIAQSLVALARPLGLDCVVVDPRAAFATEERFPQVRLCRDWPDAALPGLQPDARCAVVALTHDPKFDDPALDFALQAPCFYIGALGSRRSHAKRLDRLAALGHGAAALARIRGPVGLPIGAVTAAEIALSILAEIVAARRGAALGQRGPAA